MFFDGVIKDPDGFVREICDHAGIAHPKYSVSDLPVQNKTRSFANPTVYQIALIVNKRSEGLFRKFPNLKSCLMRIYYAFNSSKNGFADPSENTTKAEVKNRFSESSQELRKTIAKFDPDISLPA